MKSEPIKKECKNCLKSFYVCQSLDRVMCCSLECKNLYVKYLYNSGQLKIWNKWKKGCFSEETIKKMSEKRKGRVPWNKGTIGVCKPNCSSFKKGQISLRKGKLFLKKENRRNCNVCNKKFYTTNSKNKNSCSYKCSGYLKRKPRINKKCLICSKEFLVDECRKDKAKFCSRFCSNKSKMNKQNLNKGRTLEQIYGKERAKDISDKRKAKLSLRPSSYEKNLQLILERLYPNEWRYTGNGNFWMGYPPANPDFVHNYKNIFIEVFASRQKALNFGSEENYKKQRAEHFAKYGYETIFFNEREYKNEDKIKQKIDSTQSNVVGTHSALIDSFTLVCGCPAKLKNWLDIKGNELD